MKEKQGMDKENRVIKALELCTNADGECHGCTYRDGKYRCMQQKLLKDALTLIVELKQRVESAEKTIK